MAIVHQPKAANHLCEKLVALVQHVKWRQWLSLVLQGLLWHTTGNCDFGL